MKLENTFYWDRSGASGDFYTKAQTDALLAQKAGLTTSNTFTSDNLFTTYIAISSTNYRIGVDGLSFTFKRGSIFAPVSGGVARNEDDFLNQKALSTLSDILVNKYDVVWDSKETAVSAGTNLKNLLTTDEWTNILNGTYYIKTYTTSFAGDTSYQADFTIQFVIGDSKTWQIDGGWRKPFGKEDGTFTTCYGCVKVNKTNGEVRFFAVYNDGLNINFDIRKILLYKRVV